MINKALFIQASDNSLSRVDLLSFFSHVSQDEKNKKYKNKALTAAFSESPTLTGDELEHIWPLSKVWPELKLEVQKALSNNLKRPRNFKEAYIRASKLNSQELKDFLLKIYTTADSQYKIAVNALYGIQDMPQELFAIAFQK